MALSKESFSSCILSKKSVPEIIITLKPVSDKSSQDGEKEKVRRGCIKKRARASKNAAI